MTVTAEGMTQAIWLLDTAGLISPKERHGLAWAKVINRERPATTDEQVLNAVSKLAVRPNDANPGAFVKLRDVIAEVRNAHKEAIDRGPAPLELEEAPMDQERIDALIATALKGLPE